MINLALKRKTSIADGESSKLALIPVSSLCGSSHQCTNCGHHEHTSGLLLASPLQAPQEPLEGLGSAWSVPGTKLWSLMRKKTKSQGGGGVCDIKDGAEQAPPCDH